MYKILIDTCVWLDLAKDNNQTHLISVLEDLVQAGRVRLIVPELVVIEYDRNKQRIIKEGLKSVSGNLKKVKDLFLKVSGAEKAANIINELNEMDFQFPKVSEAVMDSVSRIETLIKSSEIFPASNEILVRAAKRGIELKKPFQASKNSINDAVIIETYVEQLSSKTNNGYKFFFVTHNKSDFSNMGVNEQYPHPDFGSIFSKIKSRYFIKLSEALHQIEPDLITEKMMEEEFAFEPRSLSELLSAEEEFALKIWYNRHQIAKEKIADGRIKIVKKGGVGNNVYLDTIWEGAKKSAKKVEERFGKKNLSWDDFEWGMLNGKLSALRWVMGDEWDELYT